MSNEGQSPSAGRRQSYPQGKPESTAIAIKKSERFSAESRRFLSPSLISRVSVVDIREKAKHPLGTFVVRLLFLIRFSNDAHDETHLARHEENFCLSKFCAILFS